MKLAITILAIAVLAIGISNAYAQEASVSIVEGAALADCREDFSNDCYNPGILTINKDTTVTWTNDDNTSHTVTSGISFGLASMDEFKDATPGPDGLFDSGVMASGSTFSFTFDEEGEYNYFCSLHPFMVGKVIVEAAAQEPEEPTEEPAMNVMEGTNIDLETDLALPFDREANDSITLKFVPKGEEIVGHHLDYEVTVTQDGEEIWNNVMHDHDGTLELVIMPGEGEITVSGGEASEDNTSTAPYTVSGAVFNVNGQYTIDVQIVGIDHTPLDEPTAAEQFSISVVPEFPLVAIIPMVVGFTAVLAVMRMKRTIF